MPTCVTSVCVCKCKGLTQARARARRSKQALRRVKQNTDLQLFQIRHLAPRRRQASRQTELGIKPNATQMPACVAVCACVNIQSYRSSESLPAYTRRGSHNPPHHKHFHIAPSTAQTMPIVAAYTTPPNGTKETPACLLTAVATPSCFPTAKAMCQKDPCYCQDPCARADNSVIDAS
jgi:hypothetical protein